MRVSAVVLCSAILLLCFGCSHAFVLGAPKSAMSLTRPATSLSSARISEADIALIKNSKIIVDEEACEKAFTFPIPPEELILLAKRYLVAEDNEQYMADDFKFNAPIVGPLGKAEYVKAVKNFDFKTGFPDLNERLHHFRIDPFQANRVWYTGQGTGTNTGDLPGLGVKATNKKVEWPPQSCSLVFNEDGLVTETTLGYVMDRNLGNTGGMGAAFGMMYAIGKPLPFPEAQPYKPSLRYKLFQLIGNIASRFQKDEGASGGGNEGEAKEGEVKEATA